MQEKNILEISRKWLGTRFQFAGRVKKNENNNGGIDCIGLIMKVGEEINANYNNKNIIIYDYLNYSKYPNKGEMKNFLDNYFIKTTKKEAKVGDLIYFNFENNLEHIAIITDIGIIHCCIEAKCVVEHRLNEYWNKKIIDYYKYSIS